MKPYVYEQKMWFKTKMQASIDHNCNGHHIIKAVVSQISNKVDLLSNEKSNTFQENEIKMLP